MNKEVEIKFLDPLTIELKNLLYENVKVEELTVQEVLSKYSDYLTDDQKSILKSWKKK